MCPTAPENCSCPPPYMYIVTSITSHGGSITHLSIWYNQYCTHFCILDGGIQISIGSLLVCRVVHWWENISIFSYACWHLAIVPKDFVSDVAICISLLFSLHFSISLMLAHLAFPDIAIYSTSIYLYQGSFLCFFCVL